MTSAAAQHHLMQNRMHEQHKTIDKQTGLLNQQANLIHSLVSIIDSNHLGHLLDTNIGNVATDEPSEGVGEKTVTRCAPGSPITWTGSTSDFIPVLIAGKQYRGFIMDDDMIGDWNQVLNLRRKISKYKNEYDIDQLLSETRWAEWEDYKKMQDSEDCPIEVHEKVEDTYLAYDAAMKRCENNGRILEKIAYTKKVLNRRIAAIIRGWLIKHDLRTVEDMEWLDELRAAKQKDPNGVRFKEKFDDEEVDVVPRDEPLYLDGLIRLNSDTDSSSLETEESVADSDESKVPGGEKSSSKEESSGEEET